MPAVTRQGDLTTGHDACYPPRPPTSWSPTVYANDKPVIRVSDTYAIHGVPPCVPHAGALEEGSPDVYVEDKQLGRIGDPVDCGDTVAEGSSDVFANG